MTDFCRRLAGNETFQSFILLLIVLTAVLMGLETVPEVSDSFPDLFFFFFAASQIIFVVEIVIRLAVHIPKVGNFFKSFWNTFDFTIVGLTLIPFVGPFAIVARLLRVLRVLRIVSVSKKLRGFVERLTEAFDEIAYTALIVGALGYIFSISGYYLFGELDPAQWGSLSRSGLSVFYLFLLQNVSEILEPLLAVSGFSILFFIIFYVVAIGLFVSVVVAALAQAVEGKHD